LDFKYRVCKKFRGGYLSKWVNFPNCAILTEENICIWSFYASMTFGDMGHMTDFGTIIAEMTLRIREFARCQTPGRDLWSSSPFSKALALRPFRGN
jgi:hypothetical protein